MVFQPQGEKAQWRICFDLFEAANDGDIVTYEALGEALGMNPKKELSRIQGAARKAGHELLRRNNRAVEAVNSEGYKLVMPSHQISMAGNQIERATTALERGQDLTTNVRLEELSEGERALVQVVSLGFAQVATYARQIGRRLSDHEDRLTDIEKELARLRDERNKGK